MADLAAHELILDTRASGELMVFACQAEHFFKWRQGGVSCAPNAMTSWFDPIFLLSTTLLPLPYLPLLTVPTLPNYFCSLSLIISPNHVPTTHRHAACISARRPRVRLSALRPGEEALVRVPRRPGGH